MTGRPLFGDIDGLGLEDVRQRLLALQAIIARAPVPIAIAHDPECRVITANRALATMLGMPEDANISLTCLLYTSPSPRDGLLSRMPSSA